MRTPSSTIFEFFASRLSARGMGALLAAAAIFGTTSARAADPAPASKDDADWVIEIRPLDTGYTAAVSGVAPAPVPQGAAEAPVSAAPGVLVPRMTYAQAMAQIPFNREEYEANPSYRHDSAMELMFGALRPTTIMKQNIPYFSRYPDFFRNRFQIFPYTNTNPSMNFNYLWSTNAYTN